MPGLKRHTVKIVAHDPAWAMLGEELCRAVRDACGELIVDVQHVGSTAVPGLPAKPVIDIVVAVRTRAALPELSAGLARIGYLDRGDRGDAGGYLFIAESTPDVRTIHLHVVEQGSGQWRDYLQFRDLLRQQPEIRERYAELKTALAHRYPNDTKAYTAGKAKFIGEVLVKDVAGNEGSDSQV